MKVVLFVDDENLTIKSLKRIFSDKEYCYIYKSSAVEALQYMESNPVDLLCSDILMPEMDGFDLLRTVKRKYPKVIRVAMTGLNRTNHVKRLTNENLAQLYLFKPWDENELKINLFKILKTQNMLYSHEVMMMLQNLESLPTIPDIYNRLNDMLKKDFPIEEISALIEEDQSITAVILKVANSAYYGRKTGNIHQAIMNIGLDNLNAIILANSVFQDLSDDMDMLVDMWKHATNSNKLMTAIYSQCLKKTIPSLYASAGLLHDIGKVVLYHGCDQYKNLLTASVEENMPLLGLELKAIGVTHQDLGSYLLNLWALPFAYVEVAMYHHRPLDYRIINRELVAVSHISHYYSSLHLQDRMGDCLDEKVFALLKLSKKDVEKMIENELGWRLYE
ncbi:MAG: HDOD domain-containing protein [Clostridiales bacterium]|nr:HDOD domain-containing protein [Clostridiales bacterium]